jgi:hypothetical protein
MKRCKYDVCWQGQCKNEVVESSEYCQEHLDKKCWKCNNQAVGDCHKYNGLFVCGSPMCLEHQHLEHV